MDTVLPPKTSNKNKYIIIAIITLVVLIVGVIAGLMLMGRQQLVEQEAAVPTGIAKVSLSPETKTLQSGESFSANVLFDSAGNAISALTIQLEYTYSGAEPPIVTTTDDIQINSKLPVDNLWDFPVKSVTTEGGKVLIKIAGFSGSISGYTSTGQEVLATINFEGVSPGSINVQFNPVESKITLKSDGSDTLLTPQSTGRYTVSGSATTTASPTPTTSPTGSSTATPTPTSTTGPTTTATSQATNPPIPDTGVSVPFILGTSVGILLMVSAVLLAI